MSVIVNGSNGLTFNDGSTQATAPKVGMVNRIINGAMMIDQRNAGASVTGTASSQYTLDRWKNYNTQASKLTIQQNAGSVTPPAGFINYLGVTSSSAYSVISTDEFSIYQQIEGLNVADLGWGTANAATVTLSFWVRSSLTGTFGGSLRNSDANRSYPFSYTISAANTWTQISVTIAGDTTGTWLTTNGVGIGVFFSMGAGSSVIGTAGAWAAANRVGATGQTNLVGTNGATFYITGVQLEKGSTATSFDYRPYGTELALCQRYYYIVGASFGGYYLSNNSAYFAVPFTMRAAPSVSTQGSLAQDTFSGSYGSFNGTATLNASPQANGAEFYLGMNTSSSPTNGASILFRPAAANSGVAFSAEL